MPESSILLRAKETLNLEISGLNSLRDSLDCSFEAAVRYLYQCKGKVIVTGMGKSGIIGNKIAATLTSTGTPSLFLHSGEGSHGDLGIITETDVVIAISFSGETQEVSQILGHIHAIGVPLIGITGKKESTLGQSATVTLEIPVEKEACPLGLAPTTSTTTTLALGDALAMCLLEERNFRPEDFALFHPGGSLGKKLTVTVQDVMVTASLLPLVEINASMRETLDVLSKKNLGIVIGVNEEQQLKGVFTTGDLMRLLEQKIEFLDDSCFKHMNATPKTITSSILAAKALHLMETHSITCLVVTNEKQSPVGVVQIYDILRAGVY